MKDLLYKKEWTKEELKKMDIYFFEDHIEELASMDNETIIRFIDACDEIIGHSIAGKWPAESSPSSELLRFVVEGNCLQTLQVIQTGPGLIS